MQDVCADLEAELAEFNSQADHVHLLASFPPMVAVTQLVSSLKGVSSRRMRQEFPGPGPTLLAGAAAVVGSYFAGSAHGAPISVLRQYIEQEEHPLPGSRLSALTTGLMAGTPADT